MKSVFSFSAFLVAGGLCFALAQAAERAESDRNLNEPIQPLSRPSGLDPEKVRLGKKLFLDPILSLDRSIACASCHDLNHGGADHLARSRGVSGEPGEINAPTVYNSGLNISQFWDGRARTLEEQIDGPLLNEKEMGSHWSDVIARLNASPDYAGSFHRNYGRAPDPASVRDAIAVFERSLVTVDSRFDRFLRGDPLAISDAEKAGYGKFKSYGCIACHQGAAVGGNMFQKMGVMGDYFAARGNPETADLGRFNVTHEEADRNFFKVPSLRNAALTSPYFHDGSARTLEEAIRIMAKYQLGRTISDEDVGLIRKFLESLVGTQESAP